MSTSLIPVYSTSAALLFTEQELGGPCTEVESYPSCTTGNQTVLCQGNGDRVGLIIINMSSATAFVGLYPIPDGAHGIPLVGGGGSITLNVRDDFTLPSRQWNGSTSGGTAQLYVLEIIRYKALTGGQ